MDTSVRASRAVNRNFAAEDATRTGLGADSTQPATSRDPVLFTAGEAGDAASNGPPSRKKHAAAAVAGSAMPRPVGKAGPSRAPPTARNVSVMDYQPDVCKDYKETGYCGYGSACKFLHDRSDYKAGWQIDQEWEEEQKKKRKELQDRLLRVASGEEPPDEDEGADKDELPFACYLCRKEFVQPIVTVCGHYFCEACALRRYRVDPTCAVCQKQTHGLFNKAAELQARIDKKAAADEAKAPTAAAPAPSGGGWTVL